MEIQIVKITNRDSSPKLFGILLNKVASEVKMLHWFIEDHNAHVILGDLHDDITGLFDELEEEIIGTSRTGPSFPVFEPNIAIAPWDNEEFYGDNANIIDNFFNLSKTIKSILTSMEFESFAKDVQSGIINTRDAIVTKFNKAEYLISMVKI
jgi:hypothetical protein